MSTLTLVRMAQLIGQALEEDGWSQVAFAQEVGVSQKHLCQVLGGHSMGMALDHWADVLDRRFEPVLLQGRVGEQ